MARGKPFDPDFGKTGFPRDLFRLRFRELRVSQTVFARRFGLTVGAVKDQEQGRFNPPAAFKVLVAAIELDPELVARAAAIAMERWPPIAPEKTTGHPQLQQPYTHERTRTRAMAEETTPPSAELRPQSATARPDPPLLSTSVPAPVVPVVPFLGPWRPRAREDDGDGDLYAELNQ